jgi:hypothetical protein
MKSFFSIVGSIILPLTIISSTEYIANAPSFAQSIEIAQNPIQEQEIRDFIDKVNQATNNRDVDGLVEMISPSAQIITVSEIGSSATTINIDNLKESYRQGFANLKEYQIKTVIDSIDIKGNSAQVNGKSGDVAIYNGSNQIITSEIDWSFAIEKQNGDLKIVRLEDKVTSYCVKEKSN